MKKTCTNCKVKKNISLFYRQTKTKDGLYYECKVCCNIRTKKAYLKNKSRETERKRKKYLINKEKILTTNKIWRKLNKTKVTAYQKSWVKKNKDKVKNSRLKYNFGITLEEYQKLLEKQNNKCKICNNVEKLVVDHNHLTGKIRGLLCSTCNSGIGMLKENVSILKNAIIYLEEINGK
jgi:hypothetical protein